MKEQKNLNTLVRYVYIYVYRNSTEKVCFQQHLDYTNNALQKYTQKKFCEARL